MNLGYETHKTCRLCNSDTVALFSLGEQYVSNFVSEEEVKSGYKNCPKCPIDIELCKVCRLVQSRHTAPQELLYARKYWYKSGVSQLMRDALRDAADAACRSVYIHPGDVVLDIGSNDGTLLRNYSQALTRVGCEPADNLATSENYEGLTLIHDFWNYHKYFSQVRKKAKIITALGMFYDLEEPQQFIDDIALALDRDGVFIAQLMCLRQTVDSMDVGNFCHEHLEFYSLYSLCYMLSCAGLGIFDIETNNVNGGSYRLYICHKSSAGERSPNIRIREGAEGRIIDAHGKEYGLAEVSTLVNSYQKMLANFQTVKAFILKEHRNGKKIFVRGASTKGNCILQWYGLDNSIIQCAADMDPAKWGKYTVGTGIPIMSLEAARQFDPDYMLVLPYAFTDEIVKQEEGQKWRQRGGRFIVPIPEMRII